MMRVSFLDRSYAVCPNPAGVQMAVRSYSKRAVGGCYKATIEASGSVQDLWQLLGYLRYGVEIREGGILRWWGVVNSVEVTAGTFRYGVSMDELANNVSVIYTKAIDTADASTARNTTTWSADSDSVSIYGYRDQRLSANSVTDAQAQTIRDAHLSAHKYPQAVVTLEQAGDLVAKIDCIGWFHTLNWQYYENSSGMEFYAPSIRQPQNFAEGSGIEAVAQKFATTGNSFTASAVAVQLSKTVDVDNPALPSGKVRCRIYSDGYHTIGTATDRENPNGDIPIGATSFAVAGVGWLKVGDVVRLAHSIYSTAYQDVTITSRPATYPRAFIYEISSTATYTYNRLTVLAPASVVATAALVDASDVSVSPTEVTFSFQTTDGGSGTFSCNTTPRWVVIDTTAAADSDGLWLDQGYYSVQGSKVLGYTGGGAWMKQGDATKYWKYCYPDNLDLAFKVIGVTETTQQIAAIVASKGQHIAATVIEDASGEYSTPYRAGDNTAQYELEALLAQGVASGRRLLASVGPDRVLSVYQEPASTSYGYMASNGTLNDTTGAAIDRAEARVGMWVAPKDVLSFATLGATLANGGLLFIEQATYRPDTDEVVYVQRGQNDPLDVTGIVD